MTAFDIIGLFGGSAKLSDALGIPLTTVHRWGRANFVPPWRQARVLELAVEHNIPLSTTDFPTEAERISLTKVAA